MSEVSPTSSSAIDRDNPWPGLATFTEDQRAYFHGRDEEIIDLTQLAERRPLVVLFGQSGLGKSSILQAGVFPRLRTDGFCPIYIRLDHSDAAPSPTEQIKAMVRLETAKWGKWTKPDSTKPGETLWEFFHHRDDRLIDRDGLGVVPVLVFDQFEELFTLGAARGERRERALAFIRELAELVENRPSAQLVARLDQSSEEMESFDFGRTDYRVIISLREDFLPDLETLKTIMPALMQKRMRLARMTGTQALEAVLKPGGALVTAEVARAIVEFVAGARGGSAERLAELDVEPPLLSVICRELNDRRRSLGQAQITADLVSGNRREILTDFYERSVADLPEAIRTFVEDRLLTKSGFRDNLALETALESPGVTRPLIDTLVARRLVRLEDRLGVQRVELTHDVLAEVIRGSRDERQQRAALAASGRRAQRQRWVIAGLATAVAGLCVGAFFGIRAQRRAEQAAREADAQSSRTDFIFGAQLLEQEKVPAGLAYLVRAARSDATNRAVGPRLISALVHRSFAAPVGEPLMFPDRIGQVAYAGDSRHAVVMTRAGLIQSWDLAVGRLLRTIDAGKVFGPFVLSPDGRRLAIVGLDGPTNVHVWDVESGRHVAGPLRHEQNLRAAAIAFSPDGRWLLTGNNDRKARLWDAATGELKFTLPHESFLYTVGFSADGGRCFTTVSNGPLRIWQVADGTLLTTIEARPTTRDNARANTAPVRATAACFSPDGVLIAVCSERGVQLHDATTGAEVGARLPHAGPSYVAIFTADGKKLITTSNDGTAGVWEVPSGRALFSLRHSGGVGPWASLAPDNRHFFTVSADGIARLWDLATGRLAMEPIRTGDVQANAVAPDGSELLTGGNDRALRRWRAEPGAAAAFEGPQRFRTSLLQWTDASASGPAVGWEIYPDRIQKLDRLTGRNVGEARAIPVPIFRGNISPNGQHAAVQFSRGGSLEMWDLRGTEIVRHPLGEFKSLSSTAFTPDSTRLLRVGSDNTARLWDTTTGALVASPTGDSGWRGAMSPDSRQLALGLMDGRVLILDCATGTPRGELPAGSLGAGNRPAFSWDSRLIATSGADGVVQVWDATTYQPVGKPILHRTFVRGAEFSRDNRRLLTFTGLETRVWDVATGAPLTEPLVGGNDLTRAMFHADDTRIATYARTTNDVRLWDAVSGQLLSEPLKAGQAFVAQLNAFAGDRFMDAGGVVWPLPPQSGREPVPEWLLRLATVVAGGEMDARGVFREQTVAPRAFDDLRRELAALPDDGLFVEWGRWFLADRATRSIAPGLKVTAADVKKLQAEFAASEPPTAAAPAPAQPADPTDPDDPDQAPVAPAATPPGAQPRP